MKRFFTLVFLFITASVNAQLLSWSPAFIQESSTPVVITMDASLGNQGLLNYTPTTDVYVHIGVITNKSANSSDWKYVPFTWATTPAAANAVYLGSNKWSYTITGGLRTFFGISDVTEHILKIAILFRSGNGNTVQRNADGSDMYVPVYDNGLYARIDDPFRQPLYVPAPQPMTKNVGDPLTITANASQAGTLNIYFNGLLLKTSNTTSATVNTTILAPGNQQIIATASNGGNNASDTFNFVVSSPTIVLPLPPGVTDGINYEPGDTSAILVLYAPLKQNIFVLGDFNNWTASLKYQMNETPDSKRFWIRITGLTSQTEYAYQYLIDGTLQLADYNTEKVLDKNVDPFIPSSTYPNIKPFPAKANGSLASVIETGKPLYNWQVTNFQRPDKRNLVIYELLVRDFVAAGNWQTLQDTLSYLKRLGVNAIEVMPFNNFEGASSWGYNPNFYFAPDKVYGTETALKQFIDACHQQGMAVIMDMVLNHSFGSSPMVQMYFDNVNNIPATNSPWFAPHYTHAYDVGYQFNNATQATADFRQRVVAYWLTNYHIDGYRFDLAKGFTPTNTCDVNGNNCDPNAFANYDQARVNIWDTIYKQQQAVSAGSYTILEMFSANNEESVEASGGMLLWGNMNYNFNQATMGYNNSDLSGGIYTTLGFTQPGLVTYQESHDEERLMWRNEQYGNSSGSYNVKDTATGLKRNGAAAAFWAMIPGPKMLWEFGELGYDYSINTCADGVTINNNCRLDPKPIKWNYLQNANRKALHDVYEDLLRLRNQPAYLGTFTTGTINYSLAATNIKWLNVSSPALDVVVIGNFDVIPATANVTFPATGTWYSYLTDSSTNITSTTVSVTLQPGEYYVFTNVNLRSLALPVTWLSFTAQKGSNQTILLNWATSQEINNDHFDVERSIDGTNFLTIGSVQAGKPLSINNYTFTDANPAAGINYYRLKQVDKDGQYTYSKTVAMTIDGSGKLWRVYPNPAGNNTALYANSNLGKVELVLTDVSGKILYTSTLDAVITGQRIDIPVQRLAKGVYMLKVNAGKASNTEKIVVE